MRFNNSFSSVLLCLSARLLMAGQEVDLEVVHRIKTEAFEHSQVMDTLSYLTDRYGPRLTGSPEFDEAAEWALARMKSYGASNAHSEKWGPFGRSWSLESYTLDMTAPRYSHLVAVPLAWSSPTKGAETGDLLFAPLETQGYNAIKNKELFEKFKATWKGKLKGKILLISEDKQPKPTERPLFRRLTDGDLAELAKAPAPTKTRDIPMDQIQIPSDPDEAQKYYATWSEKTQDAMFDRYEEVLDEESQFLRDEGVIAVIHADPRARNGLLFAENAGSQKHGNAPAFVVTQEQYSRMVRLLEMKERVQVHVELKAKVSEVDVNGLNLIGEITGKSKPEEVVMIGAHFDSWHSGTGATDNGAGSAVMLEVMRILSKLQLKMDRTVRIGLWSGEEQGLFGSKAYVKAHFGDPDTMALKAEHGKLDAYLNLDNGSGKIRGVYLEGNDAARPIFERMLRPFADMGATTTTLRHTGGTDHLSFGAVDLPGFQFVQDPLDYGTVTHHSDGDTFSHAVPEDLMQASAVIASLVYDIANQPKPFPRKALQ